MSKISSKNLLNPFNIYKKFHKEANTKYDRGLFLILFTIIFSLSVFIRFAYYNIQESSLFFPIGTGIVLLDRFLLRLTNLPNILSRNFLTALSLSLLLTLKIVLISVFMFIIFKILKKKINFPNNLRVIFYSSIFYLMFSPIAYLNLIVLIYTIGLIIYNYWKNFSLKIIVLIASLLVSYFLQWVILHIPNIFSNTL